MNLHGLTASGVAAHGCPKYRYATKTAAKTAAKRWATSSTKSKKMNIYRCPKCQDWHLTSQPKRKTY